MCFQFQQPSFGPAVTASVFRRFVSVLFKSTSTPPMDSVLGVLAEVMREARQCGYASMPIEALAETTAALDTLDRVCQCSPEVFVDFFAAFMDFTADFFAETQRIQAHFPDAAEPLRSMRGFPPGLISAAVESTPIPCNVCFTIMLTPAAQRDRNAAMLERLRTTGQQGTSTQKTSKNITFVKRADLLENVVRDGEVAAGDHFVKCAYSLMRLAVRYVSQYRPQVLKTMLLSQPGALERAIETLFLFVCCTNNVDEISKDK